MKSETRTTTVGITTNNHVILAADKRATAGAAVYHKDIRKISKISDRIALTISGLVADAQFIVENAKFFTRRYEIATGRPLSIGNLANYLSLVLSLYLRVYPFIVQLLLGGYDQAGPNLYYLDLYGTVTKEKYTATGSGSPIALGVLESGYRDNLSVDEAVNLAVRAVTSALMRDGYSGEGVDVLVIGKEGVLREETIRFKRSLEPLA